MVEYIDWTISFRKYQKLFIFRTVVNTKNTNIQTYTRAVYNVAIEDRLTGETIRKKYDNINCMLNYVV